MWPKERGFTLLEILIALFIFSLVTLILAQALRSVISTQSETEKVAERLSQTQMSLLLLARDLEQAVDRPVSNAKGEVEAAFMGARTTLHFTHTGFANADSRLQRSSLQRTAYRFENGCLYRDSWDHLDLNSQSLPHSRLLLEGLKNLSFHYLDYNNRFHSYWEAMGSSSEPSSATRPANGLTDAIEANQSSIKKLPRAVKITLTFQNNGQLEQIDLLPQQELPYAAH